MRIFFGPYPLSHIFWELGKGWHFLKCLEPLPRLPAEYDNGGYPGSGGTPSGPDETAGLLQLILGLMNSFLGALGLFFFGVNLYNLLMNIQNCPTGVVLAPCIQQGHCAGVARAPWFAHYIVSQKLMVAEDLAREAVKADVPIKEVAKWLGVETVGAAKKIIMNVAETSCKAMHDELIEAPNATVNGMVSNWLGKHHASYYLEQVKEKNLDITWQAQSAKMYSCHGCVRCMTLFYFTDIQNVVELIEIFLLIEPWIQPKVPDISKTSWKLDASPDRELLQCTPRLDDGECPGATELQTVKEGDHGSRVAGLSPAMTASVFSVVQRTFPPTSVIESQSQKLNCPMIDVHFEADPTQRKSVDLHQTEVSCLGMIGRTFFFRYHYCGVPKHMEYQEQACSSVEIRAVERNQV
ncbi:unnamed protein product [Symbiodinium natans]|uniref:Uncharacterized protein n=1 Tax=Symbiodinium natans TaxID=878477 RepID=A0A812HX86_9DINO|nr:unnamed protein product [Symbiodinium natans]